MQIYKKGSASPVLIIGLLLVLIGGGIAYYLGTKSRENTVNQPTTSSVASGCTSPAQARTVLSSSNVASWKSYTDPDYGISFKYPDNWSQPVVTNLKAGTKDNLLNGDYKDIVFNADNNHPALVCIGVTTYEAISTPNGRVSSTGQNYVKQLKSEYSQTTIPKQFLFTGLNNHLFTPIYSDDYGSSATQYIETADGKFKGYYFYSQPVAGDEISDQFRQFEQSKVLKMDSVLAVLTDGNDKVVQVVIFNQNNPSSGSYQPVKDCHTSQVAGASCQVASGLLTQFDNVYKNFITSLKSN